MKTTQLFPRNKIFWLYHLSALLTVLAINMISAYIYGRVNTKDIAENLVWIAPYTMSVLGFRWFYTNRNWRSLAMGKLIPVVIVYGTIAGLLMTIVIAGIITPIFWNEIVNSSSASHTPLVPSVYFFRVIVGGTLQSQLFICAWAFIYISVTGNRHTKETEMSNLRLKNSLKEAQLSSLSNQLNPHFLFNSLNNIRFMIHENAQHADAMIIALSEILRYSLESSKHEKVKLGEEISIIQRYIAIVKIQMEQRLNFSIDIPENLTACLLPPMVLQMLVENAVKHGLDQMQQGGRLQLKGTEKNQLLLFTVSNDIPITHKKIQNGLGIGITNIRQRLHLLYGEKASMEVKQETQQFTVTISIPKETTV
jgi:sensor histidine kinase YesM